MPVIRLGIARQARARWRRKRVSPALLGRETRRGCVAPSVTDVPISSMVPRRIGSRRAPPWRLPHPVLRGRGKIAINASSGSFSAATLSGVARPYCQRQPWRVATANRDLFFWGKRQQARRKTPRARHRRTAAMEGARYWPGFHISDRQARLRPEPSRGGLRWTSGARAAGTGAFRRRPALAHNAKPPPASGHFAKASSRAPRGLQARPVSLPGVRSWKAGTASPRGPTADLLPTAPPTIWRAAARGLPRDRRPMGLRSGGPRRSAARLRLCAG